MLELLSSDELRLAHAVLLSAGVAAAAWVFVRRQTGAAGLRAWVDALLLMMVVQYASVGVCGLLGVLNRGSMTLAAGAICAVLLLIPKGADRAFAPEARGRGWVTAAAVFFFCGYLAALVFTLRQQPVLVTDGLTYHMPAAVGWMQTGSLSLHETWFFNPANTWSPLAGSTFFAWWMVPLHGDLLARFAQLQPALLLLLAVMALARALGASPALAAMLALAAALARPFASEAPVAKDDLFLSALFICAAHALTVDLAGDRLGPWRLGAAVGLMLATKYTALLSAPLLLLAIDGPIRAGWRWRRWAIAIGFAMALAGPWYVRNALLTGNPLYPMRIAALGHTLLDGPIATIASPRVGLANLWQLSHGYYNLPPLPLAAAIATWLLAVARGRRGGREMRRPLVRLSLLGPPLGIALFTLFSPYAEVRFIYPAMLLIFAAGAIAAGPGRLRWVGLTFAAATALLSLGTGFKPELLAPLLIAGVLTAACGCGLLLLQRRSPAVWRQLWPAGLAIGVLGLCAGVYIYWHAYAAECAQAAPTFWKAVYGPQADAWAYIRDKTPPDAVVGYSNTHLVYALYGSDLSRRVVYAPTRRGVHRLQDLPAIPERLSGETLNARVIEQTLADADREHWLSELATRQLTYLVIIKSEWERNPPELRFISEMPGRFERLFENEGAAVYRIKGQS